MFIKLYKSYKELFDKKIADTSLTVLIVSLLVVLVGAYVPNGALVNAEYKNNLLELSQTKSSSIIMIEGKKYELVLKELK